jgi:hypothetical protein
MKSLFAGLALILSFSLITGLPAALPAEAPNALGAGRRSGWEVAGIFIENLGQGDLTPWPGTKAWLRDFRAQTKGIAEQTPVADWPKVDIDVLLERNPNFWRMWYEVAPGDPTLMGIYAGLLLSQGEAMRAAYVVELGRHRPGIPKVIGDVLDRIQGGAMAGMKASNGKTSEGTTLFDNGDYAGALEKYREALKLCPQNGWTHYEIGYTIRTQSLVARGLPPPKPNSIKANAKLDDPPEVAASFARARRHDPLQFMAYQGSDQEVLRGLFALVQKVRPSWEKLRQKDLDRSAQYYALRDVGEGFQEAGVHDLALLARQILVARRCRYDPADHPFIAKSLRKLAPGETTEAVLKRLGSKELLGLRAPTKLDDVDGQPAWEQEFHNPVDGKTYSSVTPWHTYVPETPEPESDKQKPVHVDLIRFLTGEHAVAERTTLDELVKFDKRFESLADEILSESQQKCQIIVQFACTPSGHTIKMIHRPEGGDRHLLQKFHEALSKMEKLAVKKETVEFQFQLTVTPKK